MLSSLVSIHYYPVKSLSFSSLDICTIKKNIGIVNDRLFSITRHINFEKAKLVEKYPKQRSLNHFLTLKNSPFLNKYKFYYNGKILSLRQGSKKIISISDDYEKYNLICNKLINLEKSISSPIFLLKNKKYPFFDTTHSKKIFNTISLININSIRDLEKKTNEKIEFDRFRGNFYFDGLAAWKERTWLNKIIKINNISFKVLKNIERCSAINLMPNTDKITINLPLSLKKLYNHIDMGVYLEALEDGEINIGDKITIN